MNIILTKILLTNAHHKHPTTHLHTTRTNATNAGANLLLLLPVLGKSVIAAKNQSVKSAINAANLTVAANAKAVKDIVGVKDTANRKDAVNRIAKLIASTNAKRNRVSV